MMFFFFPLLCPADSFSCCFFPSSLRAVPGFPGGPRCWEVRPWGRAAGEASAPLPAGVRPSARSRRNRRPGELLDLPPLTKRGAV